MRKLEKRLGIDGHDALAYPTEAAPIEKDQSSDDFLVFDKEKGAQSLDTVRVVNVMILHSV